MGSDSATAAVSNMIAHLARAAVREVQSPSDTDGKTLAHLDGSIADLREIRERLETIAAKHGL